MQKIARIEVVPLARKLAEAFHGSTYRIVSRNTLYVKVETDGGVVGEAFGGDEDIYQQKVVEVANRFLAPRLVGRELAVPDELWNLMSTTPGLPFHNRGIHTLDLINHAVLMQAIAIIDIGLWDALGKVMGKPVFRLLGAFRDRVPVGAAGLGLAQGIVDINRGNAEIQVLADRHGNAFVWEYSKNHNKEYVVENPGLPLVMTNFTLHTRLENGKVPSPESAKAVCKRYAYLSEKLATGKLDDVTVRSFHRSCDAQASQEVDPSQPPERTFWHAFYYPEERRE